MACGISLGMNWRRGCCSPMAPRFNFYNMLLGLNVMVQTIDYSRSSLSSYERHPNDLFGLDWTASLDRQALVLFRNELVKLQVV